ncbi:MAG: GNAT family N-acetyltransferase [Sphingopyxis terrae]|nr:MAG: GNAT family N-acetyltransferase [Sphingopyxis terrae]
MPDPTVTALREAADHRGFRLVASRKRTPGTGDYGRFGLTDPKGKPVIGIGTDGLTASAEDVEAFLRRGELDTWKQSATAPAAPIKAKPRAATPAPEAAAALPRRSARPAPTPPESKPKPTWSRTERVAKRAPEPPPLGIRPAVEKDAPSIAALLGLRGKARGEAAARIAACRKAGGGVLVGEQKAVLGCLAYVPVPALHRPLSGRITTLFVAERHRREGIGRSLVEEAAMLLAKAGCETIEVMSDIEIRSAHGFFRRLEFEETSYRFARALPKGRKA